MEPIEKVELKLQALEEVITQDDWSDWEENPCTKFWKLSIEGKALEKDLFLAGGGYIDEDHGLTDAAKALGGKIALLDILDTAFEDEVQDEG